MNTSLRLSLLSLFVVAPLGAKLLGTTLPEFREHAPCGLLVSVLAVETVDESKFRTSLNRSARLRVHRVIGGEPCQEVPELFDLLFSTEVHSSHPRVGEEALVFPKPELDRYVEAVYGRSYWVLDQENTDALRITLSWRNSFLLSPPLEIQGGEVGFLPLDPVVRLWDLSPRKSKESPHGSRLRELGSLPRNTS